VRFLSVLLLLVACTSPVFAQPEPPVRVPPVELAAGMSVAHDAAAAVVEISGNLTKIIAVTSEISTSAGGASLLAGARVGTGFWYDGKPPTPGRFFAQIVAGRSIVRSGVGADVLVLPHTGISLHWAVDYRWTRAAPPARSGARLVVGALIGPRT
jgi:hypothetical protein